jgi:hypothetical protein
MAPTLIRLLGEVGPKTLAGTIVGKPAVAAAPRAVFKNVLRDDTAASVLVFISCVSFLTN